MNNPWECPRCKTINAPFTPSCNCSLGTATNLKGMLSSPQHQYDIKSERCLICNGFHGYGVQCMTLRIS